MRVEDRKLVAFVLEEPDLGVDVELEAVGRGGAVTPRLIALSPAVAQDNYAAGLVRRLGLRVLLERAPGATSTRMPSV